MKHMFQLAARQNLAILSLERDAFLQVPVIFKRAFLFFGMHSIWAYLLSIEYRVMHYWGGLNSNHSAWLEGESCVGGTLVVLHETMKL